MTQYISKSALVTEIERRRKLVSDPILSGDDLMIGERNALFNLLSFINTLEVKEVDFMKGSNYAEKNLWKPADGDDLPEFEREVVVLYQPGPLKLEKTEYCVSFAHRPDPKGWDGKSMLTGKIEHYQPKTYDKGGWNIPDVKWWLDLDLPIIEEE